MVVSLNLLGERAASGENAARKKPGWLGFCLLLLAITVAAVLYECYLLYSLREQKNAAYAELASVNAGLSALEGRLGGADARLKGVGEVLDFMLGDVRAEEILSVLAVCAAEDTAIERMEVAADGMTLFGKAKNERGVSELYRALVSSNLFSSVSKPRAVPEPGFGFSFAFRCETAGLSGPGMSDD